MVLNIIITIILLIIVYFVYVTADTYLHRQKQLKTNPNFSEPIGTRFRILVKEMVDYGFNEVQRTKDEIKFSLIDNPSGVKHEITMMYHVDNQIQFIYQAYKEKKLLKTSQQMCDASGNELSINLEVIDFFERVLYKTNDSINATEKEAKPKENNNQEANNFWLELINGADSSWFKDLIIKFLLPYNIDPIKFKMNKEANSDPMGYIIYKNEENFSKSLLMFLETPSLKAMGYPDWFYCAFPDVALWAIKGEGLPIIKNEFSNKDENIVFDKRRNKLRDESLIIIINLYLNNHKLECSLTNKLISSTESKREWWNKLTEEWKTIFRDKIGNNTVSEILEEDLNAIFNLTELNLHRTAIIDIAPLATLTNLTELSLEDTEITDISQLATLTNLTFLSLSDTVITDISILATLTNLTDLSLGETAITDISPLATLTNLTLLSLSDTAITDISPLATLTNLTILSLSNTAITDISPLATLTNLTYLSLLGTKITDISPLATLTNLTELFLTNTAITDISPLATLTNLKIFLR